MTIAASGFEIIRRLHWPTRAGTTNFALAVILLVPDAFAQEKQPDEFVNLPELTAFRLPKNEYLILNVRFGQGSTALIRSLRKIPLLHPDGIPTTLIFDKYLHKKSSALSTATCYLETDWLTSEDLAAISSVVQHSLSWSMTLVRKGNTRPTKLVISRKEADYNALVDAWADSDRAKREARTLSSTIIDGYRCGTRKDKWEVMTLAAADAVSDNLEPCLWSQTAIRQGIHTFCTSFLTLSYEQYANTDTTTPFSSREASVYFLFEKAREVLTRPNHDSLEAVLRSDLNSLNLERLSVSVALVHYILETHSDHWEKFLSLLAIESSENGKLKGPEGLWNALSKAVSDVFRMSIEDLEKALTEFVNKHYLHTEEIAAVLGIDRECAESAYQGFIKICELKRQRKPVSEKGEKLYQEILGRIQKKLQSAGEKF